MLINYWDCPYSNADEQNRGTEEDPDYNYVYYCDHPDGYLCLLDNKYADDKADCKLIDDACFKVLTAKPAVDEET